MQNMLEHQIFVLENVMDSEFLFRKELEKSLKWLNNKEQNILQDYLLKKCEEPYLEIVKEVIGENAIS